MDVFWSENHFVIWQPCSELIHSDQSMSNGSMDCEVMVVGLSCLLSLTEGRAKPKASLLRARSAPKAGGFVEKT